MNDQKEPLLFRFIDAVRESRKKWTDRFRSGKQVVEALHRDDATWDRPAARMIREVEMRTDFNMKGWQERARDFYQRDRERRWRNRPDAAEGDRWAPIRTPFDHLNPEPSQKRDADRDVELADEVSRLRYEGQNRDPKASIFDDGKDRSAEVARIVASNENDHTHGRSQ